MQRSAAVIAAVFILTTLSWALVLAFGSGPFAVSATVLLAGGLLILGTVIAVGVVLSRSRWARAGALVLLGGQAILGLFLEIDGWWIAAMILTTVSVGALLGPWLKDWWRTIPGPDAPPEKSTVLIIGLLALPALTAVTSPGGVSATGWLLSGLGLIAAWGYSRAWLPALWAIRVGLPFLGIAAVARLEWQGAVGMGLGVALLTALAWAPDSLRAVMSRIERPVQLTPIPPELTPREVLEAAGLDDRGRPRTTDGQ